MTYTKCPLASGSSSSWLNGGHDHGYHRLLYSARGIRERREAKTPGTGGAGDRFAFDGLVMGELLIAMGAMEFHV